MDTKQQYITLVPEIQVMPESHVFINDAGLSDIPDKKPDQDEIEHCEEWIKQFCCPQKTFNRRSFSYSMKHKAENWDSKNIKGYVSNGAFIQAAINLGYKYRRVDGLNAEFNMRICKNKPRKEFV